MSAALRRIWARLRAPLRASELTRLSSLIGELAPIEMRFVGRTLWHTVLVGVSAGFIGAAFFAILEWLQLVLLEDLVGYVPLRAHGEVAAMQTLEHPSTAIPWLLLIVPALGGLLCGLIVKYVPEVSGGGADYAIEAFHHHGGYIRRRVLWAKPLASFMTLGTGGAGGREGPTMMIGAASGRPWVGRCDLARASGGCCWWPVSRRASRRCSVRRSGLLCSRSKSSTATTSSRTRWCRASSRASSRTRS